jgi:hypothetical protein
MRNRPSDLTQHDLCRHQGHNDGYNAGTVSLKPVVRT